MISKNRELEREGEEETKECFEEGEKMTKE